MLKRGLSYSVPAVILVVCVTVAVFWSGQVPSDRDREPSSVPGQTTGEFSGPRSTDQEADPTQSAPSESRIRFTNVIAESGIDFRFYGGPSPDGHMIEQNAGGVGLLDFDRDGILDIFLANGSRFDRPALELPQSSRLYRAASDNLSYTDATQAAELEVYGFGQGCAAGDYDNDGFADLFLACYGQNHLWHNNGDGTFTEMSDALPDDRASWSTSAAFADLDADGTLDLYVANYVDWSPDADPCHPADHPEINLVCSPVGFAGQPDVLYQNLGDGTFVEVGATAGIAIQDSGKGLAVAIADLNADGSPDIYVANDTTNNFLFVNRGSMHFDEVAVPQGAALSSNGVIGASMGIAVADFDGNGYLDLCTTNFEYQVNDLYASLGPDGFVTENSSTGLDLYSRSPLSFGIVFADFDLDGWPDLFTANGHIWDQTSLGPQHEFQMQPTLLRNSAGRSFSNVGPQAGNYFTGRWLGRATAQGDLDNDGDIDLVVMDAASAPAILRNDTLAAQPGITLRLVGTSTARTPLGATVTLKCSDRDLTASCQSGGSFQASHAPDVIFARNSTDEAVTVAIAWKTGTREELRLTRSLPGCFVLIEGTEEATSVSLTTN